MSNPADDSQFVVEVGHNPFGLVGRFLKGPRSSDEVAKLGYAFTHDRFEAWPFPSRKAAENKARIVDLHMGWGGVCFVPNEESPDAGEKGNADE